MSLKTARHTCNLLKMRLEPIAFLYDLYIPGEPKNCSTNTDELLIRVHVTEAFYDSTFRLL